MQKVFFALPFKNAIFFLDFLTGLRIMSFNNMRELPFVWCIAECHTHKGNCAKTIRLIP